MSITDIDCPQWRKLNPYYIQMVSEYWTQKFSVQKCQAFSHPVFRSPLCIKNTANILQADEITSKSNTYGSTFKMGLTLYLTQCGIFIAL